MFAGRSSRNALLFAVRSTLADDQVAVVRIVRLGCVRIEADDCRLGRQPIDVNRPLEIGEHGRPAVAAGGPVAMAECPHRDVVPALGELRGVNRLRVRSRTGADIRRPFQM